jgi:hypothetical protein
MQSPVCPELPTAPPAPSLMRAGGGAVDNSAPIPTRLESTYKSGKSVQTSGATSLPTRMDFYLLIETNFYSEL